MSRGPTRRLLAGWGRQHEDRPGDLQTRTHLHAQGDGVPSGIGDGDPPRRRTRATVALSRGHLYGPGPGRDPRRAGRRLSGQRHGPEARRGRPETTTVQATRGAEHDVEIRLQARLSSRAAINFLGATRAESLFADDRDLIPLDDAVKSDSEPAPPPDIRWTEESVGLRRDELFLGARRRRAPQMGKPVIVVAIEPKAQELLPCEERRRSVAQLLRHAGKTQANHTDSLFELHVHHEMDVNPRPATSPTGPTSGRALVAYWGRGHS